MTERTFRTRVRAGDRLVGTFVKTPAHEIVELLALAGLDFVCLDAEHGPFDRDYPIFLPGSIRYIFGYCCALSDAK